MPKRKKLDPRNTIGYRGVTKEGNRFKAQINIGGKKHHLGYFGTTKEAAIAFDVAANHAKRPRSDLNFPDMNQHSEEEVPKRKKRKLRYSNNPTGFNGVSKEGTQFRAQIEVDGTIKNLGLFILARDAGIAYDHGIVDHDMSREYMNFPDGRMPIEDQEPGEIWF